MTTITNPADPAVQAIFLKGHLRLQALGMSARGLTKTDTLKKAGAITGNTYKRGQQQQAIDDLEAFIKTSRNAKA